MQARISFCQSDQNTVESETMAAQNKTKPWAHCSASSLDGSRIPLCWYYYYERDRCCVVINVGPRKMRVGVVYKVWGALYVRWNKTLSVSLFFFSSTNNHLGERECEAGGGQYVLLAESSCSSKKHKGKTSLQDMKLLASEGSMKISQPCALVPKHKLKKGIFQFT